MPLGAGVLLELGREREIHVPLKRYFDAIGSFGEHTIADRYRHIAYYNKH